MNPFTAARWIQQVIACVVIMICVVLGLLLLPGCAIGYKNAAPLVSWQKGPEVAYAQEGAGVQSRTTNGEQQQARNTAPQLQLENKASAEMASNLDETKTVGLKQGIAQDDGVAQGRDGVNATQSSTGKSATGHTGNDTLGLPKEAAAAAAGGATGEAGLTPEKAAAAAALLKSAAAEGTSVCPDCDGNGVGADGKACAKCGGKGSVVIPTATVTPAEPAVPASAPAPATP